MSYDPFRDFQDACLGLLRTELDEVPEEAVMSVPPRREFGDLSSNAAFLLAKPMRRAPRQIAQDVVSRMDPSGEPLIAKVEVAGAGYVNFFMDYEAFAAHALDIVQARADSFGAPETDKPLQVIVEHTSVNPNKEWHIGHARNCVLGDVVARMYRAAGHQVEVQNYIDDTGKQASDSLFAMQYYDAVPDPAAKWDHFVGEQYVKLHRLLGSEEEMRAKLEALAGDNLTAEQLSERDALQAQLDEIESVKAGIESLMHDVEQGKYVEDVAKILDAQLATAWELGASYDLLSWEGDIVRSGLFQEAMNKITQSPYVYKAAEGPKAGCWVINMTEFWEGGKQSEDDVLEKVLVRSNGLPTYEGKDIAYQMWKFGLLDQEMHYRRYTVQPDGRPLDTTWREGEPRHRPQVDKVINVIGAPQSYAQAVVYTALRVTGHEKAYQNSHHLAYGMVYLRSGHMSGRKGIGMSADDVLRMTYEEALARTEEKRGDELDQEALAAIARAISTSAVRYCMVQYNPAREILFDIDQVLSLDGNTSSYLQYALVRTESLLRRAAEDDWDVEAVWRQAGELDFAGMDEEEAALINAVARYPSLFQRALDETSPHMLTDYAFELAGLFTQFYHKCAVLKAEERSVVARRLALSQAVKQVLSNIFQVLGLERLEAM